MTLKESVIRVFLIYFYSGLLTSASLVLPGVTLVAGLLLFWYLFYYKINVQYNFPFLSVKDSVNTVFAAFIINPFVLLVMLVFAPIFPVAIGIFVTMPLISHYVSMHARRRISQYLISKQRRR